MQHKTTMALGKAGFAANSLLHPEGIFCMTVSMCPRHLEFARFSLLGIWPMLNKITGTIPFFTMFTLMPIYMTTFPKGSGSGPEMGNVAAIAYHIRPIKSPQVNKRREFPAQSPLYCRSFPNTWPTCFLIKTTSISLITF